VYGVQTGHNPTEREKGRAIIIKSPYQFNQPCKKKDLPPFPSSSHYDAKVWSVMKNKGEKGALFWNVAK